MIENMEEFAAQIRKTVSDRLDLLREVSDEEIRECISEVVME